MNVKQYFSGIFWMLAMLVLSIWMAVGLWEYEGLGAWMATFIVVLWICFPFVSKLFCRSRDSNLISNIIFSVISGFLFSSIFIFICGIIFSTLYTEFVYELVDDVNNKKRNALIRTAEEKIQTRINIYKEMLGILVKAENHRPIDRFIELLVVCSDDEIGDLYIEKHNKINMDILQKIEEVNNQNMLKLNIRDKTITQIKKEIIEKIEILQKDKNQLEIYSISKLKYYDI